MFEGVVGVIVGFVLAVWTDEGCGADEDFPGGVAFEDRSLEPLFLFGAPDGFLGAVWHVVGGAVVAAFAEPDLEVFAPTEGAVGGAFAHGGLFEEDLLALSEGEVALGLAGPTVVVEGVVIVFEPIGAGVAVEFDQTWEAEHALPVVTGEADGGGFGGVVVVVDEVSGEDGEVGVEGLHQGVDGVAVDVATIGEALAGHDAEVDGGGLVWIGGGLEAASECVGWGFGLVVVGGGGL